MAQKNCFDMTKLILSNNVCHCGAVVKEFLESADKPGSTPGDAAFCLFVPCFSPVWSILFFLTLFFLLAFFFIILTADPAGHALGSIYITGLSPEFYFGQKGFQKLLICVLAKLTTR